MSVLDRIVGAISPSWALKREGARFLLGQAREGIRRYEGAERGHRTKGWIATDSSAQAATRGSIHDLRARCRDLRRNNPHAVSAVRELVANVAGRGLRPKFTHDSDAELSRAGELWEEWATNPAQADANGRETFYGLQDAMVESMVEGGECLIRRRLRRATSDRLAVPLQIQAIEGDHLDTFRDGETDGSRRIIQGVAFDQIGQRVGYYLYPDHPGDTFYTGRPRTSRFVPADGVSHFYRADRLGQVRGIPWGAPIVIRLHDFDKYEDAEAVRMEIAASFAGFVHDLTPDATFRPSLAGTGGSVNGLTRSGQPIDELPSGTIEYLGPGKTITFPNLPQNEGFPAYSTVQLRAVAKGYGVPYWLMTGDLSGINFATIRADWVGFSRNVEIWRDRVLVPHGADMILRWWRDAAELVDLLTPGERAPDRLRWELIPPRREMLDPRTEVMAEIAAVRAGFKSLRQVVYSLGSDPDTVLTDLAEDLVGAREKDLQLTTDGKVPDPGEVRGSNAQGAAGEDGVEESRMTVDLFAQLRARGLTNGEAAEALFGRPVANGVGV